MTTMILQSNLSMWSPLLSTPKTNITMILQSNLSIWSPLLSTPKTNTTMINNNTKSSGVVVVVGFKVRGLRLRCLLPLSAEKNNNIQSDSLKNHFHVKENYLIIMGPSWP
jgi:hypothetical protein